MIDTADFSVVISRRPDNPKHLGSEDSARLLTSHFFVWRYRQPLHVDGPVRVEAAFTATFRWVDKLRAMIRLISGSFFIQLFLRTGLELQIHAVFT